MKKIYMILAALTLLSMSLNAQMQADHSNYKVTSMKAKNLGSGLKSPTHIKSITLKDLLRSTKGMSSIMPQIYDGTPVQGLLRAPLKINSDEVTVGPFTGDNFDNGVGFGNAYSSPQDIFIETDLVRSEYADHIGDDIIGFRLALYGDGSHTVDVGQFMAWPGNSDGSFDQDHLYTWSIGELTSGTPEPYTQYVRINSTSDLESGAEYLIVCENNSVAFNGGLTTLDAAGNTISVTPIDGIIESTSTTDAATFTITANGNNYTVRSKSGYYIGRTQNNSNGLQSSTTNAYTNTITFSGNNASIRCSASTARYLRYNSNASDRRFRYYQTTTGQNIQLYKKVTVTPTAPAYVALQDGQWHEFYLDEPVPFVVGSDNVGLSLGYTYIQYPTGTSGQNLFPIAVNSQSTSHNHYAYMTVESQGGGGAGDITITCQNCFQTSFYYIIVVDNATGDYLTYWAYNGATYTNGNGQTCWELPNGWSLDGAAYFYQETVSGYNLGYLSTNGPGSIVISSSAFGNNPDVSVLIAAAGWDEGYTVSVNGDAKTIESGTIADYEWNPVNFSGGGGTTTNTGWYQQDFSQFGDLAVQLIFKSKKLTPEAPTVTNQVGSENVTITITPDPNTDGQLVYYVIDQNGQQTTDLTFPRGETDYTVTVYAHTTETDNYFESPEAVVTVTIPALKTDTPIITVTDNEDGTYTITATGDGTVTLTVGGQTATGEGSASIIIVRSIEDQIVTATATAQADNLPISDPATQTITIPALNTTPTNPESGLLRLHLLIVDQMKEEIPADNSHPDRYSYVLRYEPNGVGGEGTKESGTVKVDIQKADCDVMGAYTLNEIDNDTNIGINHDQGVKMNVISADVEYDLSSDNDILYAYLLQGAENRVPGYQADFLTELQKTQNFTYVEMLESNPNKGQEYQNGEHHFFVGEENLKTGDYGSSYMSYAPSVSTWGISRRYYEDDGYDNTYGAPIWKTGAGQVKMDNNAGTITLKAERQTNTSHSVNWTDENGQAASVYILDGINAVGKLPHSDITTIEYEPYMFRIFVESPNGKLRNYQFVDADPANTTQPGEHAEGVTTSEADSKGPLCVWSGYIKYGEDEQGNKIMLDDPENGVSIETGVEDGQTTYIYHKVKVDRPEPTTETDPETGETTTTVSPWTQNKQNAMFGALDDVAISGFNQNGEPITKTEIDPNDLTVFVRFYFNVKGMADDHVVAGREGDSSRPGNGSESPGFTPEPWTAVNEVVYNGEVVSRTYVNALGMQSDQPFDGVNIVITRYSDGKVSTAKVVR